MSARAGADGVTFCGVPASRRLEFWSGVRDELPLLVGVAPFGMAYGALAVEAGVSAAMA